MCPPAERAVGEQLWMEGSREEQGVCPACATSCLSWVGAGLEALGAGWDPPSHTVGSIALCDRLCLSSVAEEGPLSERLSH